MKKIYTRVIILLTFIGSSCSDEILEKLPKDQLTVSTTFTTNSNFETYAWSMYANSFPGYWDLTPINREMGSDLLVNNAGTQGDELLWQRKTVPSSSSLWSNSYINIRRANLMLDNIDNSELTDGEKQHWKGVGLFFRAYEYVQLIANYGEVPWVDKSLTEVDEDILYGPKTSRNELSQFVLNDLLEAENIINPEGSGPNTINTDVVRALISRFGLYEGTWRKYHGLGDETRYLQASVDASTQLIADHPNLHSSYDEVFNSETLNGVEGILLYKAYEFGVQNGRWSHYNRSSIGHRDLTKKAVDQYLCLDGETIHTSDLFDGEQDAYDEFRNRDHRLYFNTPPPFRVYTGGQNQLTWEYDSDPKSREYIDLMATLSDDTHKTLPTINWRGLVVRTSPHFRKFNEGHGYNVTYTGYAFYKFSNKISRLQNRDSHDAPIFRMGEVFLNHAEAMYELGQFTQEVADATINKLRTRGAVAPLNLASIPNDPTRDADVAPALWEIRRERGIEFLGEGLGRVFDIKRWKKLVEYGAEEKLGRWVVNSDYGNNLPVQGGAAEGYVSPFGMPPGVPEHYYLEPIPSDQIVLNPQLEQNPGWE
ncbi:RagB/SusD family nutrient uptake outer membrane protein [Arenibacter troitsensis]|uniref:Starch-binding associating with outer membrane n=1 Tax=Arenibacter troitsensis TaxID=188872 RepID=A0A1X7ISW4_9FLAO|nr:RagB/SusD family nutrient uptake outer membrane protein [Arenibacter troitsensis]SMG18265.1 Starch-binding associating with outer membrane [Arenibacter troitsensis]|tara:strand:- start:213 stop:1994 length:1782 start_codon:yes stop_codon:yes gene_type:complete